MTTLTNTVSLNKIEKNNKTQVITKLNKLCLGANLDGNDLIYEIQFYQ